MADTKSMVAKMLGKQSYTAVESKHPSLANENTGELFNKIKGNVAGFKSGFVNQKNDLVSKLPKAKKLKKFDLGKKY